MQSGTQNTAFANWGAEGKETLTFGVSILSSSMKAESAWQTEEGKENASAVEAGGRPGDLSSRTLWGRRFTWAAATWAYEE